MYGIRIVALVAPVIVVGAAMAHEGAMGIVAERMSVMTEVADSMKTVGEMLSGRQKFDPAAIRASIKELQENCHQASEQFSAGTRDHKSRASQAVWENPVEFNSEMKQLEAAVKALVAASEAEASSEIRAPFIKVGQACSSCHERFRVPG
jgi:cytochrome c556